MKRDWEIIRAILLRLEGASTPTPSLPSKSFAPMDPQLVAYNMRLLHDGGYIDGVFSQSMSGNGHLSAIAKRLTISGHELLDTVRNDTVWQKVKSKLSESKVEMTIDLVLAAGKKVMEGMLES